MTSNRANVNFTNTTTGRLDTPYQTYTVPAGMVDTSPPPLGGRLIQQRRHPLESGIERMGVGCEQSEALDWALAGLCLIRTGKGSQPPTRGLGLRWVFVSKVKGVRLITFID